MLKKLLGLTKTRDDRLAEEYRELVREEAKIGGQLFGPVTKNGRREFFCLDERTWVWHEEWVDEKGHRQVVTTRYDVRPHGIFKAQDNQPYRPLNRQEIENLMSAVRMYRERVGRELYTAAV